MTLETTTSPIGTPAGTEDDPVALVFPGQGSQSPGMGHLLWEHSQAARDAYEEAINATSKPWAPWYAVPADSKSWMRLQVADILLGVMEGLDLRYPTLPPEEAAKLEEQRKALEAEKA